MSIFATLRVMPHDGPHRELTIERQVHGGLGLARQQSGEVILVAGGIPGERVRVSLTQRKGVLFGQVSEVLEASPDRVSPPLHPGLDLGHVRYERQLELKREVLADALGRATGERRQVPAVVAAPSAWGYRSAVQPVVTRSGLGYRRQGGDGVVELEHDPSANEAVNHAWELVAANDLRLRGATVQQVAIRANDDGEALLALIGRGREAAALDLAHRLVAQGIVGVDWAPFDLRGRFRGGSSKLTGRRSILQRYGELTLTVTATSFAQPNPAAASLLYRELVNWAGGGEFAVELFAGGGAIAMHLAAGFERVIAIEVDKGAVERGKRDAERLGIANVEFRRSDARSAPLPRGPELYVVDPPRAGLAAELRRQLAQVVDGRLLYVSCDVATWARDVADLERQGLRLTRFLPFDFYPQTHHLEVLSLFEPGTATKYP